MPGPLVRVQNLVKAYDEGGAHTSVLRGTGFELARGETVSLVGASGAGKSTLLGILAGLMLPDAGSVYFDGEDLTVLDETTRAGLRARRIGVVLQSDNLIPFLSPVENVELALRLAGGDSPNGRARKLLEELGLGDRLHDLPRRLSGGEAQRASLAVALANRPDLLLADEVTAELDSANADRVIEILLAASRDSSLTVLVVTHSEELAVRTNRCLQVVAGEVIER